MHLVVAGAGLGGLAAALALARAGCRVDLVERAPALVEAGAGLQLSPNATAVLRDLGVLDAVAREAVAVERAEVRRGRDGATLATVAFGATAARRYGAPFLVTHRADLQAALQAALADAPAVTLSLGTRLAGFAAEGAGVTVALDGASGPRRIACDGLVGADGLRSAVRAALAADPADAPRFSGRIAWRGTVPAARAPAAARRPVSSLWLAPRAHLVHYPVRGGALVNVVAVLDGAAAAQAGVQGWSTPGDRRDLLARFAPWCAEARALIEAVADWRIWPLFERPALPRWSRGPVTLLGDAAHPMLPFLAQGAAQALADAGALARAARGAPSFAEAAAAYEARRRPLAARVQRQSRRQGAVYHLAGLPALARDTALRLMGPERMLARHDWLYAAA